MGIFEASVVLLSTTEGLGCQYDPWKIVGASILVRIERPPGHTSCKGSWIGVNNIDL